MQKEIQDEVVTSDLGRFGYREKRMAADLLSALCESGAPEEMCGDEIRVYMNIHSGNVFLCDEDYNTAMMNGEKLEMWYNCPNCGHEGFKEDMEHGEDSEECRDYLVSIGVIEDFEDEGE